MFTFYSMTVMSLCANYPNFEFEVPQEEIFLGCLLLIG